MFQTTNQIVIPYHPIVIWMFNLTSGSHQLRRIRSLGCFFPTAAPRNAAGLAGRFAVLISMWISYICKYVYIYICIIYFAILYQNISEYIRIYQNKSEYIRIYQIYLRIHDLWSRITRHSPTKHSGGLLSRPSGDGSPGGMSWFFRVPTHTADALPHVLRCQSWCWTGGCCFSLRPSSASGGETHKSNLRNLPSEDEW